MLKKVIILSVLLLLVSACKKEIKGHPTITFGSCEVSYAEPFNEASVRKIGDILMSLNRCRRYVRKIHLFEEKKRLKFREVIEAKDAKKPGIAKPYYQVAKLLSDRVLKGRPVDVILSDNEGKMLRVLPFALAKNLFSDPKPVDIDRNRLKPKAPVKPVAPVPPSMK
ncbi:hypothetical protein KKF84_07035 [Myxococcota bacterium]|nr:hypothetical protein [Myxococcota bacterium]MBU1535056.1 hypothetical protein [Myxococcota bacterium]